MEFATRTIVLGASNVTRNVTAVVAASRAVLPGPVDLWIAAGHGRSYGARSNVFIRSLPGITQCRLWDQLSTAPPLPTFALLTDIGNDLLYEVPVDQLCAWVEECLTRLRAAGAKLLITRPPIDNLPRLSTLTFTTVRSLFFPQCRLSLAEVTRRANALDARLPDLAAKFNAQLLSHDASWYGFDPLHFANAKASDIYTQWLSHFPTAVEAQASGGGQPSELKMAQRRWRDWLAIRSRIPAESNWCGVTLRRSGPMWRAADGSTVSLY